MATYESQIQFADDLSEEVRAEARLAVAGMAEIAQAAADEKEAIRAEREAALAALGGDAHGPEPVEGELENALEALRESLVASKRDTGGEAVALDMALNPGTNVKGAPYDIDWHWKAPGTHGPNVSIADRVGGLMHIRGTCGAGDPRVDAACGVGFAVTSNAPALVEVRPYVPFEWTYSNNASLAIGASAESEGGVNLAAWLNGTCVSAGCVNAVRLFRNRVSAGEGRHRSEDGATPDLRIEFPIQPGSTVWVNLGAWIRCDSSSGVTFSPVTSSFGRVQARAQFVVIKRFVSG